VRRPDGRWTTQGAPGQGQASRTGPEAAQCPFPCLSSSWRRLLAAAAAAAVASSVIVVSS